MSDVPVLTTERLVLRGHRVGDLDAYMVVWNDPTVVKFITGRPLERHECWTRILRFRGMWTVLGYGFWIIEEKSSGRVIGEAGVMDAKRDIVPSLEGTLEAGWALLPSSHGRGLAQEAVEAVLSWVDGTYPEIPQSCTINEANSASIRLAERVGFRESGRGLYQNAPLIHYRRAVAG